MTRPNKGYNMPRLIIDENAYSFDSYATIGRSSKCTASINDIKLSRVHCEIIREENDYILIDLQSQNGTNLNDVPITEAVLQDNDKITLGRADLFFKLDEEQLSPVNIEVKRVGIKDIMD